MNRNRKSRVVVALPLSKNAIARRALLDKGKIALDHTKMVSLHEQLLREQGLPYLADNLLTVDAEVQMKFDPSLLPLTGRRKTDPELPFHHIRVFREPGGYTEGSKLLDLDFTEVEERIERRCHVRINFKIKSLAPRFRFIMARPSQTYLRALFQAWRQIHWLNLYGASSAQLLDHLTKKR
jgi:hypothetical protein